MTASNMIRPAWTPVTTGLMVLGFVAWWPLGLAMLGYILWGDRAHRLVEDARAQFRNSGWSCGGAARDAGFRPFNTGNVAFDDYRARELARLEEERRRLDSMRDEFDAFLRELRRAKDQEEFDRFMAARGRGPAA
ncbi:DUF2852 domain-containing protein [Segnochrobactraceae bacterium EtOH-i3]